MGAVGLLQLSLQRLFTAKEFIHLVFKETGILHGCHHRDGPNDSAAFTNGIDIREILCSVLHSEHRTYRNAILQDLGCYGIWAKIGQPPPLGLLKTDTDQMRIALVKIKDIRLIITD